MPKLNICDRCHFYSHSPHLVCFIHPQGVDTEGCEDFCPNAYQQGEPLEWWEPVGASYYGGELVIDPVQRLINEQRLQLLDSHPLFTGRCPHCEMPMMQTEPRRLHWDCDYCGWKDDSL
jgi:hypothetical protein